MYVYDEHDRQMAAERVAQFRDQTERALAGELAEDEFLPLRLQNGLYVQRLAPMLRICVPYGMMRSDQLRRLARITRDYDKGYAHFTTRQNVQLNWPALEDVPDILAELAEVEMHANQTSGNCIRNTTTDQFSGVQSDEIADPRPYCEIIRQWSTFHPEFAFLPRKFKVGVTVPGDNSIDLLTQDIGLVVFTDPSGTLRGCNVYVGGGMGRTHNKEETFARIADPLGYVAADDVLDVVQSIMALQRDHGDREVRKHARMKYLIHDKGIEWFRSTLQKDYFHGELRGLRKEPKPKLLDYLGWHRQKPGLWFVGLPLVCGRLQGELKQGLRSLVETYQLEIRLTANQDLLLCNIGSSQRAAVQEGIKKLGFEAPGETSPMARHAIACPALPTCGLAITESERILPDVLDRIDVQLQRLEINKSILVRMTGCPNGCARPYMAELALVGNGLNQYQLWLGGTPNLQRLARPYLEKLPLDKLESTIEPLLLSWKDAGGRRSFGDHIEKLGDQEVNDLLSASA